MDLTVLSDAMDVPIGPRGFTLRSILGRKLAKGAIRGAVGQDEKSSADFHPALLKLTFMNDLAKMSALEKEAPFKSESQRRKFYAMKSRGEISGKEVKKWERATPKGKKLPERLHRKSAEEKDAILGAIARTALKGGKAMLMPTTKLQGAAGNALWAGFGATSGAIAGAKAPTPTGMVQSRIRMAETVDRLIELTKQGIEFHSHMPASTDVAEPDVKKNDGKIAQVSASSSGAVGRMMGGMTSARGSSTKISPGKLHMGGLPGAPPPPSPNQMNVASGVSPMASSIGGGGQHIPQNVR